MADRYASLKQGLVGCWIPSVSGSGLLLPDLSGRNNNGSLVGMDASDWVSSGSGRALDFDGVDDVVRLPFSIELPFTVSGWFSSRSTTAIQYALSICSSTSNAPHYSLIFDGNAVGDLIYAAQEGDATAFQGSSFTGYVANQMYHLTGVFRSSTNRQLYVNANAQAANTTSVGTTTVNRLAIGRFDRLSPAVPFDGVADDIRLYSRALTEVEIRLLASEPGIGFKRISSSAFATRYAYKPAKPRNYSVIRNRDPNYSTLRHGLVAAYCPSISGQGNVLPDLVGGNHGTLTNMDASDWVSSGDGRALDFDGSNDYVSCGTSNNSLLVQSKAFSISAWIYLTSTTSDRTILTNAKITPNYDGMNFLSAAGKLRFDLGGDASPTFPLKRKETTSAVFSTGIWYHVAVTKPAGAATSAISLYVNGVQPATTDAFNDTVADAINSVNLQIAARDGANSLLQGQIDDVRLYSRALSEPEIKLLASKRGIGLEPRKPKITFTDLGVQKTYSVVRVKETDYGTLRQGLVGAWCPSLPNGGSGNTLPDVSGYNNHGSLVNMSPDDWVSGQYGRALDFDGSNDYVLVPNNNALNFGTGAFSVCAWVNATNPTINLDAIFGKDSFSGGSSYTGYLLNVSGVGPKWAFETRNVVSGSGPDTQLLSVTNAGTGWTHLVGVRESTSPSTLRLWVNGVSSNSTNEATSTNVSNITAATIGALNEGLLSQYFNGQLDDIRLYNRALTEPEIRLLASRPGIGLRQESHRNTFYQFPSGSRRRRILTGMP